MALKFLNDGYFAGKVGIGKSVPTKPLDVVGNAQVEGTLTVETSNNNIRLLDSNDSTVNFSVGVNGKFQIRDVAGATNPFQIEKGAISDSLYIKANGNVGIGTGSPGYKLQVNDGNVAITGGTTSTLFMNITTNQLYGDVNGVVILKANDNLRLNTNGAERIRVTSAGNVGIGTTSPLRSLSVFSASIVSSEFKGSNTGHLIDISNSNASPAYNGIRFQHNNTFKMGVTHIADGTTRGYIQIGNGYAAGNEILVVDGRTSNVGIGTTSPTQKLHVSGNARVTGAYYDSNNSPGTANQVLISTVTGTDWIDGSAIPGVPAGSGAAGQVTVWSGTDVITGYTRFQVYDAGGQIQITDGTRDIRINSGYSGSIAMIGTSSSHDLGFMTGNSQRVTIDTSGNVGIGTTSPSAKLEVTGNTRLGSGTFHVSSDATLVTSATYTFRDGVYINNPNSTSAAAASGNVMSIGASSGNAVFTSLITTGAIGIGKSNPSAQLDVVGTGNFTGLVSGITPVNAANFVTKAYVDGSGGGTGPFLPLAGGTMTGVTQFNDHTQHGDQVQARWGASNDFTIEHNATDSSITNITGDLYITNKADDKDIVFRSDDGSGGFTTYFKLDGSAVNVRIDKPFLFTDNVKAEFGSSQDLQIYHDSTNSYSAVVDVGTGYLLLGTDGPFVLIGNSTATETYIKANNNSSVDLYFDNSKKFETTSVGVTVTGGWITSGVSVAQANVEHTDNTKALFGNGNDLQIYHDSSDNNSYIKELGSGSLQIWAKDFEVYNAGGTETLINADVNAGVQLYFNNSPKIATTTTGVTVTGTAKATAIEIESAVPSVLFNETDVTANWRNRVQSGGYRVQYASDGTTFTDYLVLGASTNTVAKDTTFTEQAFSSATSSGDASSTLTTKGYVDSLITGATIYRGTWDPDVSLNSGYGNPNLNTVTQTSGYYYICSADGAATPNGATTEPNTWNTGDWVIWNDDIGTSGEWQKIDNSSVLSGVGTGQTVALWEGASSVTDSETLGNAPITVSGNNTTFAGSIYANTIYSATNSAYYIDVNATLVGLNMAGSITSAGLTVDYTGNRTGDAGILVTNDGSDWGIKVDKDGTTDYGILSQTDGENAIVVRNAAGVDKIQLQGDGDATFAGTVTVGDDIIIEGNELTFKSAGAAFIDHNTVGNSIKFRLSSSSSLDVIPLEITPSYVAFLDVPIVGTMTAGNNTTRAASTAFVTSAVATGVGDYLPLSAGSGFPLTGNLFINNGFTLSWGADTTKIAGNSSTNELSLITASTTRMRIDSSGNVGIGNTSPNYKLSVSGGIEAGGLVTYSKVAGSLNTTGYAVAGLTAGFNGASAGFEFKCYGSNSKYQRVVYSCHCSGTTWVPGKVIDEGTNDLDVVASANGATITFTFKARSSTQNFSPRIVVQATGHSINSTYA